MGITTFLVPNVSILEFFKKFVPNYYNYNKNLGTGVGNDVFKKKKKFAQVCLRITVVRKIHNLANISRLI